MGSALPSSASQVHLRFCGAWGRFPNKLHAGIGPGMPCLRRIMIVRVSSIGNIEVKWDTVKGRVENSRRYGCRKILPDLDRHIEI